MYKNAITSELGKTEKKDRMIVSRFKLWVQYDIHTYCMYFWVGNAGGISSKLRCVKVNMQFVAKSRKSRVSHVLLIVQY